MPLKFSEMTALRVDLALNLEAGFSNYLETVADGYGTFVESLLEEGETAPDIRFQIELLKRGVARARQRLESLTSEVTEQSHEDAKVRAELERRLERVDGKLRLVRHTCRGIYGDPGVERTGLKQEPPRGAARLHEYGTTAKASLENPDLGLEPLIELDLGEGVAPPQVQLGGQLEPELSELGELVDDRHEENRKSADIRSRRRQVILEFDHDVRAIVRTGQGLFRLAGRDDLAERFRPLLRRVIRRIKKADAADAADQAAENGETGSEPAENGEAGSEPAETTPAETSA